MVRIKADQSLAVLCLLQLRLQPVPAQQDGGHQEEDAGHEGRRDIQSQLIQPSQVEKDNACDRVDASEEQCKAARVRIFFTFSLLITIIDARS